MSGSASQPERTTLYVFVSYASADRDRVLPIVEALRHAGVVVWLDQQGIAGGANYGAEIADAIKNAAALVLMASAVSLASRNVKQEVALAWEYACPYLPLLLEVVTIPDDLKYWLTAAQWIEVVDTPQSAWLPAVLAALAPLGIAPTVPQQEEMKLAGRERELALLREKLVAANGGRGGLELIGGEAGVGKTTLAEAALREAADAGFIVLEGHCFDLAETPPYGPWIDLFAHYVPSPPHRRFPSPSPGAALSAWSVARWPFSSPSRISSRRSPPASPSCCFSTISTGPTPPASTCCASWRARWRRCRYSSSSSTAPTS